ncbi:MAG: hypothetical protein HY794_03420 [Desulfarculus sp.]|nr:hypothetical protein [Desulfarculus sp.]
MSQSEAGEQAITGATPEKSQDQQAPAKSSWGRTLALTGVALFVAGLFMGGLFKDSPAGTVIVKVVSFGGMGCLALGLIGVGLDALKKKSASKNN